MDESSAKSNAGASPNPTCQNKTPFLFGSAQQSKKGTSFSVSLSKKAAVVSHVQFGDHISTDLLGEQAHRFWACSKYPLLCRYHGNTCYLKGGVYKENLVFSDTTLKQAGICRRGTQGVPFEGQLGAGDIAQNQNGFHFVL